MAPPVTQMKNHQERNPYPHMEEPKSPNATGGVLEKNEANVEGSPTKQLGTMS